MITVFHSSKAFYNTGNIFIKIFYSECPNIIVANYYYDKSTYVREISPLNYINKSKTPRMDKCAVE